MISGNDDCRSDGYVLLVSCKVMRLQSYLCFPLSDPFIVLAYYFGDSIHIFLRSSKFILVAKVTFNIKNILLCFLFIGITKILIFFWLLRLVVMVKPERRLQSVLFAFYSQTKRGIQYLLLSSLWWTLLASSIMKFLLRVAYCCHTLPHSLHIH